MVGLAFAALPGIMIGTPDQPTGGESEGASQVKELSPEIKARLPETDLELSPTSKEEKQEILFARKININEADIDKLQEIPNVGINTAQAIIKFRKEGGEFYRIEDLDQIEGIGKKTVEDLQPHITVGTEFKNKAPAEENTKKIDINTAGASRLNELPGVGEVTAGKIIKYREKYGGFAGAEDIKNVDGIGPTTFEKMKGRIEVSAVSGIRSPRESSSGGKININRASAEELEKLPGVGETYAERIVEYRRKHGSFTSLEELTNVSGIGPVTVSQLRSKAEI